MTISFFLFTDLAVIASTLGLPDVSLVLAVAAVVDDDVAVAVVAVDVVVVVFCF